MVRFGPGACAGRGPEDIRSSPARCECRPGAGRFLGQSRTVRVSAGGRKKTAQFRSVPVLAGGQRFRQSIPVRVWARGSEGPWRLRSVRVLAWAEDLGPVAFGAGEGRVRLVTGFRWGREPRSVAVAVGGNVDQGLALVDRAVLCRPAWRMDGYEGRLRCGKAVRAAFRASPVGGQSCRLCPVRGVPSSSEAGCGQVGSRNVATTPHLRWSSPSGVEPWLPYLACHPPAKDTAPPALPPPDHVQARPQPRLSRTPTHAIAPGRNLRPMRAGGPTPLVTSTDVRGVSRGRWVRPVARARCRLVACGLPRLWRLGLVWSR